MAVDILGLLSVTSLIIIVGFVSNWVFERTMVPDILPMILLGILLGPLFGILSTETLGILSPLIGPVALITILFGGGLELSFSDIFKSAPRATLLAVSGFIFSTLFVGLIAHYIFGLSLLSGLMLGAILGGTSSVMVIPVVSRLRVSPKVKTILSLESAMTDVLCIVAVVTLGAVVSGGGFTLTGFGREIFSVFSMSVVMGLVVGLAWIGALRSLSEKPYLYMLTLATIFVLYVGGEALGSSGAIAVLVFGIVMGNAKDLTRLFRTGAMEFGEHYRKFHAEITFFIRAFFFVYLGAILTTDIFSVAVFSSVVVGAVVLARLMSTKLATVGDREMKPAGRLIFSLMPRGLAAAVLAALPFSLYGIQEAQNFPLIVFFVLLATNVIATVGVVSYSRKMKILPPKRTRARPKSREKT